MFDRCIPAGGGVSEQGSSLLIPIAIAMVLLFGGAVVSLITKRRYDERAAAAGALLAIVLVAFGSAAPVFATTATTVGDDPCTSRIGDRVWVDANGDGVQGSDEPGLPEVSVQLRNTDSDDFATTVTDASGNYIFVGLPEGNYIVTFPTEANDMLLSQSGQGGNRSTDSDPLANGDTTVIPLGRESSNTDIDAGYHPVGAAPLEPITTTTSTTLAPVPQPPTSLVTTSTTIVITTTTKPTTTSTSSTTSTTSTTTTTTTTSTTTSPPSSSTTVPTTAGTIGDRVWLDLDRNGVQDPAEPGLGGIAIELRTTDGTFAASTTSAADGSYSVSPTEPGEYVVCFGVGDRPLTAAGVGNASTDSDPDPDSGCTDPVAIADGATNPDIDAGYQPVGASIGNRVWSDRNDDGLQDVDEAGLPGVSIALYDADGEVIASTTSDGAGYYQFDQLLPGAYSLCFADPSARQPALFHAGDATIDSDASELGGCTDPVTVTEGESVTDVDAGFLPLDGQIGDLVWLDLNENGSQDIDEPGLSGVMIELFNDDGAPIAAAVTGANGRYFFDGVAPDTYSVCFTDPSGRDLTSTDAGSDEFDSDMFSDGCTDWFALAEGASDLSHDAGYLARLGQIGDWAWLDENGDGLQDATEPGIADVTVELYDDLANLRDTTTTDAAGQYMFSNVAPGSYQVCFTGLGDPTTPKIGDDDEFDSDVDPATLCTDIFSLAEGAMAYGIDAGGLP